MHHGRAIRLVVFSALTVSLGFHLNSPSASRAQVPPPPPEPGLTSPLPPVAGSATNEPEALTRGPVHEAYAEPIVFNPTPGPVVPKAPPAIIEEMPPDQKPTGDNVVWIPGYWAWDDERNDFLWISGLWRDLPPGRQWVPGYWAEADGGANRRWVSGYWASVQQESANYLPEPPRSVEAGPNVPAPSQAYSWTPGYWFYRDTRYVWRPGCWIVAPVSWVWVPHHYVWSPCGFVFVPGFWDHALATRGLLFAPVVMPPVIVAQPAFVFTPSVVIQQTVLVDNLFCRPAWGHYYFGDYYAPTYVGTGFQFAFFYNRTNFGFDPISAHTMAVGVSVGGLSFAAVQQRYDFRVAHLDARPPHRFHDWGPGRPGPGGPPMAMALSDMARSRADIARSRASMVGAVQDANARRFEARTDVMQTRLERIDDTRRTEMARRATELRSFREQRVERERELSQTRLASMSRPVPAASVGGPSSARASMPRSPIASSRDSAPASLPRPGAAAEALQASRQDAQLRRSATGPGPGSNPGSGSRPMTTQASPRAPQAGPASRSPRPGASSAPQSPRMAVPNAAVRQERLDSLRDRRSERVREARERTQEHGGRSPRG
jgi:hypothetical protein